MELTNQSKRLLKIFSNEYDINHEPQNATTKRILTKLYHDMIEAQLYIKSNINFDTRVRRINTLTKPNIMNINIIPTEVLNHIYKKMDTEIVFTFSLQERNINIYFMVEKSISKEELETYNHYVEAIAIWLYIINMYSSKKCVKTLSVYLYLTSLEKQLPTSNQDSVLDANNINTAFTTTCPVLSEIIIFRREEWFKVFVHETFHNFGLDFSGMKNETVHNFIMDIFAVKIDDVCAYESYTEFWASIINALFYSFLNQKNLDQFLKNSEYYINKERTFSLFQMVKTLQYMGLNYNDLYSNSKSFKNGRENLYKENTHVFSYFILKTILLNNYQGFLNWCQSHNTSILNFEKTEKNQMQFCDFLKKNYKTQNILSKIECATKILSTIKTKKGNGNNKFVLSNMRMTICELG